MKRLLLLILLISPALMSAQQKEVKPGSLRYLDYKNGFKNIILGSEISSLIDKVKLSKTNTDSTQFYIYTDESDFKVADVTISRILIRTYNKRVLDVIVYLDKDYGHKLFSVFSEAYGLYTSQPNQFMNVFIWSGRKARLTFDFDSKIKEPTIHMTDIKLDKDYDKFLKSKDVKAIKGL